MSSNIRVYRICQFCGVEFVARTTVTKYCGDNCASRAYKQQKKEEKIRLSDVTPAKAIKQKLDSVFLKNLSYREFLSVNQAALLLGASRMTLYRLNKKGGLPFHKLADRTIILRKDIDQLLGI